MKVKYLVEEEVTILRQGIIELEVNDLSNDEDTENRAIDIFTAALESEDNFADEVRQSEKYDGEIVARFINHDTTYFNKLPKLEVKKWNIKSG